MRENSGGAAPAAGEHGTAPASVAELERRLTAHGVPCGMWGTGGAKSVPHLWREIAEGESELTWDPPLPSYAD